ncbi:MAG: GIY-YIG nuclease family protein [Candidatus Methanomethylicia archaeon]|jgi:Uri superfamily endonuclease|nr:GIY-YIG nuclease family protein [Candidatus Methanomethylicia archaeon]MCQ5374354.1 GIY-YIG nuclease family protein [Candidatus Methanomethylicia archaeon]
MKGVYAIILKLDRHLSLAIGKKRFDLNPGIYVYAGSAFGPGGVSARLGRHLKTFKTGATKKHWHIDSLLPHSATFIPVFAPSTRKMECEFVRSLRELGFATVDGFGNTDCRSGCGGHLIILGDLDLRSATEIAASAFDRIGLKADLGHECFR